MPDYAGEIYDAAKKGDIAKVDALIEEHGINVKDGEYGLILGQ